MMMRWMVAALVLVPGTLDAQAQADRALLAEIRQIRAIDNHSHIPPFAPPAATAATRDPLGVAEFPYPVRLRVDSPEWPGAWRALYGAPATDPASVLRRKEQLIRDHGEGHIAWVLDRVSIDIAINNAPALGAGQNASRFRWVPHGNSLLLPFGRGGPSPAAATASPLASLDLHEAAIAARVNQWKQDGAVAIKLTTAYSRSLDFPNVPQSDAARIYGAAAAKGSAPDAGDYTALQDYLFRVLARHAGAAGLVMHVHTGIGADPWFAIDGSNPLLLEPAVTDATLRNTKFVLIHGGWPFDRQAGAMLIKPNVYADFSAQTFLRSARALSETLRAWLEWYPEKVLFGTDAYPEPGTPLADWEEKLWLANNTAREALAMALTGMMNDGQITRARALEIARMVLRDNAVRLYGLK